MRKVNRCTRLMFSTPACDLASLMLRRSLSMRTPSCSRARSEETGLLKSPVCCDSREKRSPGAASARFARSAVPSSPCVLALRTRNPVRWMISSANGVSSYRMLNTGGP